MDTTNDGAGPEMPAQDQALAALADLLEEMGGEVADAFVSGGPNEGMRLAGCKARAGAVVRAIVALPAVTLHGASAKARAARASVVIGLMPKELVKALADDMAADVTRLRAPLDMEVAGHA